MNILTKPDIKGFVKSLRINVKGALYEVIIKYVMSNLLKAVYRYNDAIPWLYLFKNVLKSRKFLLIVLDDTRYDFFEHMYSKYINGILLKAVVPPPHTYGWLPKILSLPEFNNVRVFYASLGIKTHDIRLKDFVPGDRNIEVHVVKPKRLKHLGTVLPCEINKVIQKVGLSGRDIVWYVQPHFPWITDPELSIMLMREVLIHDFVPLDTVYCALKKHGVNRERVVKAYCCNLALALKGVKELLDYVLNLGIRYEKIVVTSDHGEMLGEYRLYLHQEYNLPQLVIVPWLEVKL